MGEKYISLESIVTCLAGVIFPTLWKKYSDKLYTKYGYLLTTEGILYTLICILLIGGYINYKAYYILDMLLFVVISKNIICGNNKLKAIRYKGETREEYDNNINIVSNLSSLIGFTLSFILTIPVSLAFILITIGICFDNIFYYNI